MSPCDAHLASGMVPPQHATTLMGHEEVEAAFWRGLEHHAWLITGTRGVGKATLAWRLARALVAGEDKRAASQVEQLVHPDFFYLTRKVEAGRAAPFITVSSVREVKEFFTLKKVGGGRKVCLVDSVDAMNRHAANALLKLLEEPPANSVFLLVAHRLPIATVRSRCRILHVPAPKDTRGIAQAILHNAGYETDEETLNLACALAPGAPGRVACLAAHDGKKVYEWVLEGLGQGKHTSDVISEENFPLFIDILLGVVHRATRTKLGMSVAFPMEAEAAIHRGKGSPAALTRLWERLTALGKETEELHMNRLEAALTALHMSGRVLA